MTIKAIPATVVCEDCGKELAPGAKASCRKCAIEMVKNAVDEAEEPDCDHKDPSEALREWAQRRFVMGQISREVRDELEQCAEDIECGHG